MAEKFGIVALKALVGLVLDIVSLVVNIVAQGKLGVSDGFKLLGLVKEAIGAFKELHGLKDEIADLSDDEKAQLEAFIESKLDIKDPAIKGYVEQGLQMLLSLLGLYGVFKK